MWDDCITPDLSCVCVQPLPEGDPRMVGPPPPGPRPGPMDGPFPRRAPYGPPPEFYPPRGPGGPPMRPSKYSYLGNFNIMI